MTPPAGVLVGQDIHLVGWNASVVRSDGGLRDPATQYARYTCHLPPDQLVMGGSSVGTLCSVRFSFFSLFFSLQCTPDDSTS